jgi:hypothetical protein
MCQDHEEEEEEEEEKEKQARRGTVMSAENSINIGTGDRKREGRGEVAQYRKWIQKGREETVLLRMGYREGWERSMLMLGNRRESIVGRRERVRTNHQKRGESSWVWRTCGRFDGGGRFGGRLTATLTPLAEYIALLPKPCGQNHFEKNRFDQAGQNFVLHFIFEINGARGCIE